MQPISLTRNILTALATDPHTPPEQLEETMHALLDHSRPGDIMAVYQAFRRSLMPVEAAPEVLADFGAIDDAIRPTLTPLAAGPGTGSGQPLTTPCPHGTCPSAHS
jgi:hypothetical protein